jgi:hypothetical protein
VAQIRGVSNNVQKEYFGKNPRLFPRKNLSKEYKDEVGSKRADLRHSEYYTKLIHLGMIEAQTQHQILKGIGKCQAYEAL